MERWQRQRPGLTQRGPEGALARSVQAGGMVFWVIVPLGAYLVLYLV